MNANASTVAVTVHLPEDVYERASQTAAHEQRPLEELLSSLVADGLNVHATIRELLEHASDQYRARLIRERKPSQSSDEVLQELRQLREEIAHDLYPR